MDITISRSATINAGNYSSIRPSVSITLKDLEILDVEKKTKTLKSLIGALFASEVVEIGGDLDEITKMGLKRWLEACDIDVIYNEITGCIKELIL